MITAEVFQFPVRKSSCSIRIGMNELPERLFGIALEDAPMVAKDSLDVVVEQAMNGADGLLQIPRLLGIGDIQSSVFDHDSISRDERLACSQVQRDMSGRMPGRMDDIDAAAPGQPLSVGHRPIDLGRLDRLQEANELLRVRLGFLRQVVECGFRLLLPERLVLAFDVRLFQLMRNDSDAGVSRFNAASEPMWSIS